jgi:predicted ferric reductase
VARIPSATLLMYHRWCGRATLVHCTIHFAGQLHHWIRTKQLTHTLANQRNQVGIMVWVSLSIIGITSINFVRRRKFELFYYTHTLFLAFIVGALIHASHGPEFLVPGLALWAIDRLIRFVYSQRIQVTSMEVYEGDVTKFKVCGLRTFHPGQIFWIQIPQVSFLNWHPFTVASAPGEDEHKIAIRGIGSGDV